MIVLMSFHNFIGGLIEETRKNTGVKINSDCPILQLYKFV